MLFNSIQFAFFLPVVFVIYWLTSRKNSKIQNAILLISSYFFYCCWDYRFLFLLILSTSLDFVTGLKISQNENKKARLIWFQLSIIINLGLLGVFKYYNFFIESFAFVISKFGINQHISTLNIILPIGISFYTFHGISYVIDVYKGKIVPEKDFIDYSLFVSFFPLLVAGPIERANHLLPQLKKQRSFNFHQSVDGLRQILWGLFKKVVIADTCASQVNLIFNNPSSYNGSTLVLGAILFAFQIYCDFSGYSDIALGTSRLFGIELIKNFAFPYFSRDIAEFWRRWHISLSSWFRDYLYIPLGGSKVGTLLKIRNTFIIFLISGFWHGANWTFVIWGLLHAFYFLPLQLTNTNRINLDIVAKGSTFPNLKETLQIIFTFSLVTFAWVFFRASNINHAVEYITGIFNSSLFTFPQIFPPFTVLLIAFLIIIEWQGRGNDHTFAEIGSKWPRFCRYMLYYVLAYAIFFMHGKEQQFIYFQF